MLLAGVFGLITFAVTYYFYKVLPINGGLILGLLKLAISGGAGFLIYFGLVYGFVKEVKTMLGGVLKK
ncbi:MAG: hypothetical protein BGN88_10660 [Clostridiales bacterium 43-6]|nr:MAG: hypothetical protein BGN88_10660 [Clostridiales bacterium 43-6]